MIDWLIKLLVNYKYKKEPFSVWSWGVDENTDINIITAEYYQDQYRYGTRQERFQGRK